MTPSAETIQRCALGVFYVTCGLREVAGYGAERLERLRAAGVLG
jgi:hypothetical protein